MSYLDQLPERGWGVLRGVPDRLITAYVLADYIKIQFTSQPRVYQARLTGAGRKYRKEL